MTKKSITNNKLLPFFELSQHFITLLMKIEIPRLGITYIICHDKSFSKPNF